MDNKFVGMRLSPKVLEQVEQRQERGRMTPGQVYAELLDYLDRKDKAMEEIHVGTWRDGKSFVFVTDSEEPGWTGVCEDEAAEGMLLWLVRELSKPFYDAFREDVPEEVKGETL